MRSPTPNLVLNASGGTTMTTPTSNSLIEHLPDAQLYPDANHGSQYQCQQAFVGQVAMFLDARQRAQMPTLLQTGVVQRATGWFRGPQHPILAID